MNIRKLFTLGLGLALVALMTLMLSGTGIHAAPVSPVTAVLVAHEDDPCAPPPDIEIPPGDDGPDIDFCEDAPEE